MQLLKFSIILLVLNFGCKQKDPNVNIKGLDELKSIEVNQKINDEDMAYSSEYYVPIYSDIYFDSQNQNCLLAATLSIRNTSHSDSLFITKIDYYNTHGKKVRSFIDNPLNITPMATVNYVIEREDDTGGAGANFIVELSAKSTKVKPLIQAVMIGETGNKSFSFITDSYLIE